MIIIQIGKHWVDSTFWDIGRNMYLDVTYGYQIGFISFCIIPFRFVSVNFVSIYFVWHRFRFVSVYLFRFGEFRFVSVYFVSRFVSQFTGTRKLRPNTCCVRYPKKLNQLNVSQFVWWSYLRIEKVSFKRRKR
jgi:hypothetical protein